MVDFKGWSGHAKPRTAVGQFSLHSGLLAVLSRPTIPLTTATIMLHHLRPGVLAFGFGV